MIFFSDYNDGELHIYDIRVGLSCDNSCCPTPIATNLKDAKKACNSDPECVMFWDNCGKHNEFFKCHSPAMLKKSICNSTENPNWEGLDLLYIKGKKMIIDQIELSNFIDIPILVFLVR